MAHTSHCIHFRTDTNGNCVGDIFGCDGGVEERGRELPWRGRYLHTGDQPESLGGSTTLKLAESRPLHDSFIE